MIYIPRFRKTDRLIIWMECNSHYTKLPDDREEVFVNSKEDSSTIASNLAKYAEMTQQSSLPVWQEDIIMKDPGATVRYIRHVYWANKKINPNLLLSLKNHQNQLVCISDVLGRLDPEFEEVITKASNYVTYIQGIKNHKRIYESSSELRIPEIEQRVFLNNSDDPDKIAEELNKYAAIVGKLPEELEDLLKGRGSNLINYLQLLKARSFEPRQELIDSLAGDSQSLLHYAQYHIHKRLPVHLEKTISDPRHLLHYAKNVVHGRLPEELENHFAKDYRLASQYAFEVIRGYACVRLPDVVHTAMVMKSYSDPSDYHVKRYISECEKDTTVSGSFNN